MTKGQTLAILEHPDYITLQEEFAETANRLEFLEQEFERQKELLKTMLAQVATFNWQNRNTTRQKPNTKD